MYIQRDIGIWSLLFGKQETPCGSPSPSPSFYCPPSRVVSFGERKMGRDWTRVGACLAGDDVSSISFACSECLWFPICVYEEGAIGAAVDRD